jgi:hypothetical protein
MAELEILEALVSFFCPTSEAASTCREFIQNHSQVLPPIGPLFYFLLFPLIFTLLFVYILSGSVLGGLKGGFRILIGVSAFIFIIISGWYPVMLVLSEFWYIVIVLLGFLWFVKGHFGKKEGGGGERGGGPRGTMSTLGGIAGMGGGLIETAKHHREGREKINAALRDLGLAEELMTKAMNESEERRAANIAEARTILQFASEVITQYELTYMGMEIQKLKEKKAELEKRILQAVAKKH